MRDKKLNFDVMYGFENQTLNKMDDTIKIIEILQPDHITLYETRYNMNELKHLSIDRDILFEQYSYLFDKIISFGYKGRFGQNTFSIYNDEGLSSYLYNRMYNCLPYKGFGVSAQSMSRNGISYNIFKSQRNLSVMPKFNEIIEEDIYLLPPEEIAAKYVCVSLYSGQFSIKILSDILKTDAYLKSIAECKKISCNNECEACKYLINEYELRIIKS